MRFKLTLTNEENGDTIETYRIVTSKIELGDNTNPNMTELSTDELGVSAGSIFLSSSIIEKIISYTQEYFKILNKA
jgi:hypothetical protein